MSWREAIIKVLSETPNPMHYAEISEQILARGYYNTDGATPDLTVNTQISSSIKNEGTASPFIKVGRGIFTLKEKPTTEAPKNQEKKELGLTKTKPTESANTDDASDATPAIKCLGMYWQRDLVVWKNDPKIYGKQQAQSKPVDFTRQRGIYVLYDHHTVVYVGRSIDRPLGRRLYEHTIDRLGSRWNRFSWFRLLDVSNDGTLVEPQLKITMESLIITFESLLIETLEPPQNRKRGDDFSFMEYMQDVDPELKEKEIQNTLRAIEQKIRAQQ